MIDLIGLLLVPFAAYLAYWLGVRRERGKQLRLAEIQAESRRHRKGTKLRRVRLRR